MAFFASADSQEEIHESGTKEPAKEQREGTSGTRKACCFIWVFPKIGVPPNHPFFFGVPLFLETPISCKLGNMNSFFFQKLAFRSNSLPFHPFYLSKRMSLSCFFLVSNHHIHSHSMVAYNACWCHQMCCPRNLQQDPRFTDPEKTWVSNSSIATYFSRGPLGFGPIQFLMDAWMVATQIFFIFTPNLGEDDPILTFAYFSKGLVQNHQLGMH